MVSALSIRNAAGTDVALRSSVRILRGIDGLLGVPGVRQVTRPLPNRHGLIDETAYMDGRVITIEGLCIGSTETAVYTEYDAIQAAVYDAIGADRLLKWTRATSGLQLQASVRIHDKEEAPLEVDNEGASFRLPWQLTFLAADPRAYSQTETTATGAALSASAGGLVFPATFNWRFTPSAGGSASVTNSGTVPVPCTLRVYGAVSSAQVILVSTGERIVLTGSIANGDYMEIDTQARTVKLNGTTNRQNLLDSTATDWWLLPTGASTVRLVGTNFNANARCDVIYRSGYL